MNDDHDDEIRACLRSLRRGEHFDFDEDLDDLDGFADGSVVRVILEEIRVRPETATWLHVFVLQEKQGSKPMEDVDRASLDTASTDERCRPSARMAINSLLGHQPTDRPHIALDGLDSPHRWVRLDAMECLASDSGLAARLWSLAGSEEALALLLRSWGTALGKATTLRDTLAAAPCVSSVLNVAEEGVSGDRWAARDLLAQVLVPGPDANRLHKQVVSSLRGERVECRRALEAIRSWQYAALFSGRFRPHLIRFSVANDPTARVTPVGGLRGYFLGAVGPQQHRASAFHDARKMKRMRFRR